MEKQENGEPKLCAQRRGEAVGRVGDLEYFKNHQAQTDRLVKTGYSGDTPERRGII